MSNKDRLNSEIFGCHGEFSISELILLIMKTILPKFDLNCVLCMQIIVASFLSCSLFSTSYTHLLVFSIFFNESKQNVVSLIKILNRRSMKL